MKALAIVIAITSGLVIGCGDNQTSAPPIVPPTTPDVDAGIPVEPQPTPGITFFDFMLAIDVSPDGLTAVLEDTSKGIGELYFVDTVSGAAVKKADVGDPGRTIATGVSTNGRVSALHGEPVQAGVWSESGGWVDLGSPYPAGCDQDISGGFDISADGKTTVGLAWQGCSAQAFRWSQQTGFVSLAVLGSTLGTGMPTNRATVISDDGTVMAGFAENNGVDRSAAVWAADGSGIMLENTQDATSEILSISGDGRVLAGIRNFDGFVWTAAAGMSMIDRFAQALPSDPVFANAMTADGTHVFGGVGDAFFSLPTAFVWSAADGMQPLVDVVRAAGFTVADDTILESVLGSSADGRVLVGTALVGETSKTFVLVLPADAY